MVYSYVVKNAAGTTIASREFEYQSYTSSSYGSFTIPTAGKYTITWSVGGYSLVVVSGTYHKKPNYSNYHTYTQSFTATGADVVGGTDATYVYDGTGKTARFNIPYGAKGIQYFADGSNLSSAGLMSWSPIYLTNAGEYNLTVQYNVPPDYLLTGVLRATLTILPKEVSISNIEVEDKVYDGTCKAVIRCGGLAGIIEGDDVSLPDVVYGEFLSANAGEILVTLNEEILVGKDRKNYDFFEALTATITPAPLKIKANDLRIEKGDAIPQLTYEIVEGQLYAGDQLTGTLSVDADANLAGNYEITQGTLSAGRNYDITFVPGTLSVKEREKQDVVVQSVGTKTYGDESFGIAVADNNAELGEFTYASSNSNVASIDESGKVTIKKAGTTEIEVSRAGNEDYADFKNKQTLTVEKADIVVTADTKTKRIGTGDPVLTYTYTGRLVGSDAFTGSLIRKDGEAIGKYDILLGTLAINDNYNITYNKAIFEIVDKTPQNITVSGITEKTYGDASFVVTATPDAASQLSTFTFESSNPNVAEITADGTVTIKNAGETNITVKQAGNDDYAAFVKTQKLVVKKAEITITADAKTKRIGTADPELTYQVTGELANGDSITGSLIRKAGERIGKYDILIGTLAINDNYKITYNKAVFEIVDKTPQNITVSGITEKTYGDASFVVTATPDAASQLSTFTFESSNPNVAEIAADGTVTIKNAGETNITVKQAGNDDYAAFVKTQKLVVKKAAITITADAKTKKVGTGDPELTYQVTGELVNGDSITGSLARKSGERIGKYDILIGTLAINNNYKITYNKAIFEIVDKTPQNITVSGITEKTYGDASFVVTATPDAASQLSTFTFESSNPNVAEIAADGTVTIKNAGETNIAVKQAGNDDYAAFVKTQKLVVKKVAITITADAKTKRVGTADPELTYQVTGELVNGDSITGSLTRKSGERIGKYDILIGTLAINDNYKITYNKAIFEIVDKTLQTIVISDFPAKTYGDDGFIIEVTPDATSALNAFTYTSGDETVATVDESGAVTIVGAGKTEITVSQSGNDDYASATVIKELVVDRKPVTVDSIDLNAKTAVLSGVLEGDASAVTLDFNKLLIVPVGEADVDARVPVKATNFVLAGEEAANYSVTTEEIETEVSADRIVTVSATAENGSVVGCGTYLKDSEVTLTATPNSGYKFSGWHNGDAAVSKNAVYTFIANTDTALVARFTRRSSGGGGGGTSTYSILIEKADNGVVKCDRSSAAAGNTVTLTAIPADGYTLEKLTVTNNNGAEIELTNKSDGKYTFKMPTSKVTVKATFVVTCPCTLLKDIDTTLWYHKAVDYVISNELMAGYGDGTFGPDDALDRAMVVQVLYNYEKNPGTPVTDIFADVKAGQWYTDAIRWATQKGIVAGYGDGNFGPQDRVTIEQVAVILWNYASNPAIGTADLSIVGSHSSWAVNALAWAVSTGLFEGMPLTDANATATRAQTAQMLMNFLSK